ncbi:Fructosamine kinase-domain-containing protein [Achaetomium macrosporum]|uniref:protein-ribulosamine 3-kinase n=1 Tax=Achaetomium macrosporum TaxID=79813 RepID=A0AAN7CD96_9PEZI|nr:Fructosamine kinase-domain-containing protein [Achaetomium macrosporum]
MSTEPIDTVEPIRIGIGRTQAEIEQTPTGPLPHPVVQGPFEVDENVVKAFPVPGSTLVDAVGYGQSLWGNTAKVIARLPDGSLENYFLKVVPSLGRIGKQMCEGEFESLKAIDAVSPGFVPKPYAWGKIGKDEETYFLLVEYREIERQPAEPEALATKLADLHKRSVSPTGKLGFHVATCHAKIVQAVDQWDDSWCAFDIAAKLTLEKVVPRLLLPLQSDGRVHKPCLLHGDCWDGNTAMDERSGEAFIFDVCSFYGHNGYDMGNWRAPRLRLSRAPYIKMYQRILKASEPKEDWGAQSILDSLPYNIGNTIYIIGSTQRQVVYGDMTTLCKMFCPEDLRREMELLGERRAAEERAAAALEKDEVSDSELQGDGKNETDEERPEQEEG